jgi:hypothetical protein
MTAMVKETKFLRRQAALKRLSEWRGRFPTLKRRKICRISPRHTRGQAEVLKRRRKNPAKNADEGRFPVDGKAI